MHGRSCHILAVWRFFCHRKSRTPVTERQRALSTEAEVKRKSYRTCSLASGLTGKWNLISSKIDGIDSEKVDAPQLMRTRVMQYHLDEGPMYDSQTSGTAALHTPLSNWSACTGDCHVISVKRRGERGCQQWLRLGVVSAVCKA